MHRLIAAGTCHQPYHIYPHVISGCCDRMFRVPPPFGLEAIAIAGSESVTRLVTPDWLRAAIEAQQKAATPAVRNHLARQFLSGGLGGLHKSGAHDEADNISTREGDCSPAFTRHPWFSSSVEAAPSQRLRISLHKLETVDVQKRSICG